MSKKISRIAIAAITVLIVGGGFAYSFFKAPKEASVPITAVSISQEVPSSESGVETSNSGNIENVDAIIFSIRFEDSEARFKIDEILKGDDKTVVGVTNQVAGEISFDVSNPTAIQMSPITINARSLVTDNEFRNRTIKNRILHTNEYEYVTFTPKTFVGLPENVTIGETYDFQIAGELSIIDTTRDVTFDVSVMLASKTEMEGSASVSITCEMFGIVIPASRSVDLVEDEIILELDFVSSAQS
ncbi:MAG: YceI family protein [Chloroflexi bacterium]|nr:YceI family protein [Chloroflexota bacterium]